MPQLYRIYHTTTNPNVRHNVPFIFQHAQAHSSVTRHFKWQIVSLFANYSEFDSTCQKKWQIVSLHQKYSSIELTLTRHFYWQIVSLFANCFQLVRLYSSEKVTNCHFTPKLFQYRFNSSLLVTNCHFFLKVTADYKP